MAQRRCILGYALIAAMLVTCQKGLDAQQASPMDTFSIYCNSNMDSTGNCQRIDINLQIRCILIPGGVVACKDEKGNKYECVQYGAILAGQTQFSCQRDVENKLDDKILDGGGKIESVTLELTRPLSNNKHREANKSAYPKPHVQDPYAIDRGEGDIHMAPGFSNAF